MYEEGVTLLPYWYAGYGGACACALMGVGAPAGHLTPFRFTRRPVGENDVKIKVAYCGICHSDLHQIHNDWKNSTFPMVPG